MFGKRITLAASASLVGASFLLAQTPPSPVQQQTPSAAPAAPVGQPLPTAPIGQVGQPVPSAPVPTQRPSQPQGNTLPGQDAPASRDVQPAPAAQPVQVQPAPLQPGQAQPGQRQAGQQQPGQQQPRPNDNSQNSQQGNDNAQRQPSDDAKFIVRAGEIDLAEINIGRLGAQRASRQDIRQFANRLVQDHSANLNQLNQMANRNNWRSGERMDQEHQQLFQKLATLQGQQFDNEFLQKMVEGHKKAVEVFKHASENCKNAEIKQFATQTLAAIRQHEQEAQRLSGQNQPQATQPTSTDDNNANRNGDANRNQNRRDDR